jgi:hypothetical protein
MKNIKIFYSWQSDLPNATNRGFIEKALQNAVKAIRDDDSIKIEPVIDRDTQGVPGAPDIAQTILQKIEQSQIFVCDVSIINRWMSIILRKRAAPNPNVLVEPGYALKVLGPECIIMVLNAAYGKQELLPFDLRMKRVVSYYEQRSNRNCAAERKRLEAVLTDTIKAILDIVTFSPIKKRMWPSNGIALAKEGHAALEKGEFDTVKEVFFTLGSLSTSIRHESFLRGRTPLPDATPFPLMMKLLRSVIETDWGLFSNIVHDCRRYVLIGNRLFTDLSHYETLPDKSFGVITGVLSACCIYTEPSKDFWAEEHIVEELCSILVSLVYVLLMRGIELPQKTSEIWYTPSGERAVPDGQPQDLLPFFELVYRMAFLPKRLFDYALANLRYDQNLREDWVAIDTENGLGLENTIKRVKSWAAISGFALTSKILVKDQTIAEEYNKLIRSNNEIGIKAVSICRDNLISERNCLYKRK